MSAGVVTFRLCKSEHTPKGLYERKRVHTSLHLEKSTHVFTSAQHAVDLNLRS